jgi:hypothetical protein
MLGSLLKSQFIRWADLALDLMPLMKRRPAGGGGGGV